MYQLSSLPPAALKDLRRLDPYDWSPARIAKILNFRYGFTLAAADVAMKSADVQIGFMDRFCGSLIITGGLSQVQTAVEEVVRFFDRELGFKTCAVHRS